MVPEPLPRPHPCLPRRRATRPHQTKPTPSPPPLCASWSSFSPPASCSWPSPPRFCCRDRRGWLHPRLLPAPPLQDTAPRTPRTSRGLLRRRRPRPLQIRRVPHWHCLDLARPGPRPPPSPSSGLAGPSHDDACRTGTPSMPGRWRHRYCWCRPGRPPPPSNGPPRPWATV